MSPPSTSTLLALRRSPLPDVQSETPELAIALGAVGVRGMRLPIVLAQGPVVVSLDASVDVPATQRGAHMSRFRRAIDAIDEGLEPFAFATALGRELLLRHPYATRAEVVLRAPALVGDLVLDQTARALAGAEPAAQLPRASSLALEAFGATACPCSFAMSGERYAHAQRAALEVELFQPRVDAAGLHALCASAFSAPVAMVLDRPAEKALVDRMFAHPRFVEDVAREAVSALQAARAGSHARLRATAFESIHPYDCFAAWEGAL